MPDPQPLPCGVPSKDFSTEEARIRAAYAKRSPADTRYSWYNRAHLFIEQEYEQRALHLLQRECRGLLEDQTILEVGCGNGFRLRQFIKWGARPENLCGVELLADAAAAARELSPERMTIRCTDAVNLDWPDGTFDVVLQNMAFTSMLDSRMKQQVAKEMLRVLRPDGFIFWYDFLVDNPRNPDVRGVGKREVADLFPGCRIDLRRITLAPPLARKVAPYSLLLCHFLNKIPLLRTHYLGTIRRDDRGAATAGLHDMLDAAAPGQSAGAEEVCVRPATMDDLSGIIDVHMLSFPHFFLTSLGPAFLRTYYTLVMQYGQGVFLAAEHEGRLAGFAAGFVDPPRFYEMLTARRSRFIFPAMFRLMAHPQLVVRLFKSIRRVLQLKKNRQVYSATACELASIAVHPRAMGLGMGKALLREFIAASRRRRASRICLTTDADNNDAVNRFYREAGFGLLRTFEAPARRRMNEYGMELSDAAAGGPQGGAAS